MPTVDKSVLRRRLLAARAAVDDATRSGEAESLCAHLETLPLSATTVCAYVPVGTEPGSIGMLDTLADRGARVLLPVVTDTDGPLSWGEYRRGRLVDGRFGLLEPAPPRLPASVLADATVVLVPALAVDRRGTRLGRGAGCYDRSLPLRGPNTRLIAVVRDVELVDRLPSEPHDVQMTDALTPGGGVVALGPE